MKKCLFSVIAIVLLSVFFISCEKELSFENGGAVIIGGGGSAGGSALYSFNGGTAACTGATLSGTFTAGTAVTAANKVVLNVTVDSVGTYTVTSSSANGISFSGSGTFTATGTQTITLTASGTPTNAGNFNFTAGSTGCTFSVIVEAAAGGGGSGTDYIRCKIDGVSKTFNDGAFAINFFGTVIMNGVGNASSATTDNLTITLTNSNIDSLEFTPGVFLNMPPAPGKTCMVAYIPNASDSTAPAWASATAGQSGIFSVNVTSITTDRVQGTFSGTLYDNEGNGSATKAVTNGEFSVPQ